MLRRALIETAVVLAFVVSVLVDALYSGGLDEIGERALRNRDIRRFAELPDYLDRGSGMISIVQQPVNAVLWGLLLLVVLAALLHLALRGRARFAGPVPTLTLIGLLAASIWPWVIDDAAAAGLLIAALAPIGVVAGMIAEERRAGLGFHDLPMAAIAGWLIIGGFAALAMLLHLQFGLNVELAQLVGLLGASLAIVWVQLRLGDNISCALVAIWAFIGIAAASFDGSMTIATACVLGISAMAVVLVRVTT